MLTASPSPPTGLMPRFGLFIAGVKRAMGEGLLMRQATPGGEAAAVGPLVILLGNYLSATLRRLTALHTRFAAGTLRAAPRQNATPRPAAGRAIAEQSKRERRAGAIPPGPVLLRVFRVRLDSHLRALLEEPEMRALLAGAPQVGRLLRPLWRKLSLEPLPEMLRLPLRPRKPRAPRPPGPAKPAASGPPGLRRVTLPDGTTAWEPKPCHPFDKPPPRQVRARPVEPPEPAPAPLSSARPPPARDAPRSPDPNRQPGGYNWIGRLFVR
jgi:hypothetical protein